MDARTIRARAMGRVIRDSDLGRVVRGGKGAPGISAGVDVELISFQGALVAGRAFPPAHFRHAAIFTVAASGGWMSAPPASDQVFPVYDGDGVEVGSITFAANGDITLSDDLTVSPGDTLYAAAPADPDLNFNHAVFTLGG